MQTRKGREASRENRCRGFAPSANVLPGTATARRFGTSDILTMYAEIYAAIRDPNRMALRETVFTVAAE